MIYPGQEPFGLSHSRTNGSCAVAQRHVSILLITNVLYASRDIFCRVWKRAGPTLWNFEPIAGRASHIRDFPVPGTWDPTFNSIHRSSKMNDRT